MKEDIKVSDWSPLLVIPWQSRQLEESTSHPGSLCTQRRVSDPFREGFIPSYMDTWGRQGQSPLKGLSLLQSPPATAEGLQTTTTELMPVTSQMRRIPPETTLSKQCHLRIPAQFSVSPCAVSFCLGNLCHPAKNGLINTTGKYSASGEKLCLWKAEKFGLKSQNCPPFLITDIFILITVSPRSHILPQNTSPLFKRTRQLPSF